MSGNGDWALDRRFHLGVQFDAAEPRSAHTVGSLTQRGDDSIHAAYR